MIEPRTGTTATSDGVAIAWDRRGSGPPMVLVHGITDRRQLWWDIADRFAGSHHVVCLDVRGHGESGRSDDYGVFRLAADVAEVVTDLELERPVLIGHSLGGVLVTGAAPMVDARAVVNVDQSLALSSMAEVVAGLAEQLRSPETFVPTLAAMFAVLDTPGLDAATRAELDAGLAAADQEVVLGIWGPMLDGPDPEIDAQIDAVLAAVTMPYLAVHGIDPGPDYPSWLAERVPHAELEVADGVGHFPHLVDPAGFVARVERFLEVSRESPRSR